MKTKKALNTNRILVDCLKENYFVKAIRFDEPKDFTFVSFFSTEDYSRVS